MNSLDAAIAVARAQGLRVDEPRVLKDSHNLVVHLAPSPIVARISQAISELRPNIRARELELTQWLAARGLPVLRPAADEVFEQDAYELTLWPFVEDQRPPDGRAAGRALRAIDDALRDCPLDVGDFWPLREMKELNARYDVPAIAEEVRAHIEGELQYEPVKLHGDAHFRNCYFTAEGPLWADLEDACTGPPEWDAACMEYPQRVDGRDPEYDAALAELEVPDRARLDLLVLLRAALSVTWVVFMYGRHPRLDDYVEWLQRNAS